MPVASLTGSENVTRTEISETVATRKSTGRLVSAITVSTALPLMTVFVTLLVTLIAAALNRAPLSLSAAAAIV